MDEKLIIIIMTVSGINLLVLPLHSFNSLSKPVPER